MHDTISVSRWGAGDQIFDPLDSLPSFERLAPAAGASSDVDTSYRSGRS